MVFIGSNYNFYLLFWNLGVFLKVSLQQRKRQGGLFAMVEMCDLYNFLKRVREVSLFGCLLLWAIFDFFYNTNVWLKVETTLAVLFLFFTD
jgi:hypothetical protein